MRNVFLCVSLSSLSRSPFHPLNSYSAAWLTSWPREGKSSTSLGGSSVLQLGLHASFTSFLLSGRAHNYPLNTHTHTHAYHALTALARNNGINTFFSSEISLSLSLSLADKYRSRSFLFLFTFIVRIFVRGWLGFSFYSLLLLLLLSRCYCIEKDEKDEDGGGVKWIRKWKQRVDRSVSLSRNLSVSWITRDETEEKV